MANHLVKRGDGPHPRPGPIEQYPPPLLADRAFWDGVDLGDFTLGLVAVTIVALVAWVIFDLPVAFLVVILALAGGYEAFMVFGKLHLRRMDRRALEPQEEALQKIAEKRRIAELEAANGMPVLTDGACPNCQGALPLGSKFCPHCAKMLAPPDAPPTVCDACGERLLEGSKICHACGTPVENGDGDDDPFTGTPPQRAPAVMPPVCDDAPPSPPTSSTVAGHAHARRKPPSPPRVRANSYASLVADNLQALRGQLDTAEDLHAELDRQLRAFQNTRPALPFASLRDHMPCLRCGQPVGPRGVSYCDECLYRPRSWFGFFG